MKCPACGNAMAEVAVQDVLVDVCKGGCGGLWFDWMELKKVDEPHEAAGRELLEVERDPDRVVDRGQRRTCPRCGDIVMMRHFASVKRAVEVDECPQCGGFFLDYDELAAIRTQYDSEEDRREAACEAFAQMYDDEIAEAQEASRDRTERARGFARMLRFLLPSHYLRGKQPWGAF